MKIESFSGDYRFLSNFMGSITINGKEWPSVEHAYQASKTLDRAEQETVRRCATPGKAKRAGRLVTMRPDFDERKLRIMKKLVRMKFEQNPWLKIALLETGDAELVEGNTWGDRYWGVCKGRGRNELGKILMEVRTELRPPSARTAKRKW